MSATLLLLGGPTASGKTALALHAAERLNGEIVNADSMQVYAGLDLIAAQPSAAEKAAAPHHLFASLEPSERCSAGRWSRLALEKIAEIEARGRTPILVGGTGLYFKALLDGLAPAPDIPDAVQRAVQALFDSGGLSALRTEAERLDPDAAARIAAGDRQRLMRVVSVARATGRTLSELQKDTRPLIDPGTACGVAITPPREALYARIEARFDQMIAAGALEEARALAARDLDPSLPALKAVGLPPLLAHLAGETSLEEAIETAKRDSRRYAKRQFTWFSNQHPGWARITSLDPDEQRGELDRILSEAFPESSI
ncbi:MAG: tRNA (adenosine(37)-N6)-dimethylallyltransferase MiaA [Alphaproteobacteria bacterium]|nr:tRNA (adenosine(37)-N6)-dimethylallyltransferase MiaA [Alphaproteobacteria bacterium]